jgi:hypothetical protein
MEQGHEWADILPGERWIVLNLGDLVGLGGACSRLSCQAAGLGLADLSWLGGGPAKDRRDLAAQRFAVTVFVSLWALKAGRSRRAGAERALVEAGRWRPALAPPPPKDALRFATTSV